MIDLLKFSNEIINEIKNLLFDLFKEIENEKLGKCMLTIKSYFMPSL